MTTKCVDVFDRAGTRLFTYSIALEDEDCLDGEFEEMALILAESSGFVAAGEIVHLSACCDRTPIVQLAVEQTISETGKPQRPKNTVVSLVKHRMKRAGFTAGRNSLRQSS